MEKKNITNLKKNEIAGNNGQNLFNILKYIYSLQRAQCHNSTPMSMET